MSHVNHKLSGPVEGALAGGGDPASSPLYVFGPFLRMLVVGGVSATCFGASVWLAVLTVVMVSAMYRMVMRWITDGSGGSGLNEEEFGSWAVKVNASITVIEYGLTFLVSIAALVTFIIDRYPELQQNLLGLPIRTHIAIILSVLVGVAVNFGPRVAARTFGPATAAVLLLLWGMIFATIWQFGLHFPSMHWEAFSSANINFTLGGYARILALMTGIEIFANLVAAYDGPAVVRSKMAFGSLLIIMGTTCLTMIIVGPAIMQLSDPMRNDVSVFTQTMDHLLPAPFPYIGTLIGIAVLLSAAGASAQGIQNLALGLRYRHYIPAWLGQRNRFEVAANPVWIEVAVCSVCFLVFGTQEDTYLALYAAGVFILLSLTGWAAVKRLVRECRANYSSSVVWGIIGTAIAATLTSIATLIIFDERFKEGAWLYCFMIPALYLVFDRYRKHLGSPHGIEDRLGLLVGSSALPQPRTDAVYAGINFKNILVPLDQSPTAELSLAGAQTIARNYDGTINLLTVLNGTASANNPEQPRMSMASATEYIEDVRADLDVGGYRLKAEIVEGDPAQEIGMRAKRGDIDLIIMTTNGRSQVSRLLTSSVTTNVIYQTTPPLMVIRPTADWRSTRTTYRRLLVPLDGSEVAEQVIPYVHEIAYKFNSHVVLLSAAEGSESEGFVGKAKIYLNQLSAALTKKGLHVETIVRSAEPAQTILSTSKELNIDLIMMVSHGRGGIARQEHVKLGSVVDIVLQKTLCPIFLISAR